MVVVIVISWSLQFLNNKSSIVILGALNVLKYTLATLKAAYMSSLVINCLADYLDRRLRIQFVYKLFSDSSLNSGYRLYSLALIS